MSTSDSEKEPRRGGDRDTVDRRVSTGSAEISALVAREDASAADILERLRALGASYTIDEVFAVIARFDTPDILG
jgi:hypothetical protein